MALYVITAIAVTVFIIPVGLAVLFTAGAIVDRIMLGPPTGRD